jgi:hypothetical protein
MDLPAIGVAALATWRVARLLYAEDGPWNVTRRLRQAFEARHFGGFACFFCLSVWPALPAALIVGVGWRQIVLLWPALSAAAILLERAAFPATFVALPEYSEDEEPSDVLRQE